MEKALIPIERSKITEETFNKTDVYYKTDSVETIISNLIQKGVNNDAKKNPFSSLK